ncbi:hypothetical protein Mkiyose1665_44720 [Mycobacterium kiyosense]|nr:hypothetical protein SRL2020411_46820 [Mycobacterium kiyosense]GLC22048.1 hypothetical protein SRL2020472_46190 [Mycobacterium kiyosense]GLD01165.1 hypothetical protein Mkiyose1088_30310 [Mycobacterium kiyosense]GLD20564.1 hypothetical protein Mkiyose1385_46630 [Mycobacterium kiyosense]GLD37841.1 hypothetical protein Mkiyose1595_40610 [Mycobacterium kiyosense]
MVVGAWEHLCAHGELTQDELLNDLNVKRSAFVCALLAQFEDVMVESAPATTLQLIRGQTP